MFDYLRYYIVTLTALTGVAGFYLGGNWVWLGIGTFPVLMFFDVVLPPDTKPRNIKNPLLADIPLYLHVPLMFLMYGFFAFDVASAKAVYAVDGSVLWGQAIGSLLSLAWISAVPTLPISHELMHRPHWFPRLCNKILNVFYMDTNRDTGHLITHHIYLDTPLDADTPARGQKIYPFLIQATKGAYVDSIKAEAEGMVKRGLSPWNWRNKTYLQVITLAGLPLIVGYFGGALAGIITVITMFLAKMIVEGFNYLQHYGLVRVVGSKVQLHHAWNHLGAIVRPLGVEITNHINHHREGATLFHELRPEPEGAQMPSIFICFIAALFPSVWFKYIAMPRLEAWDKKLTSEEEKKLAMEANRKAGWPLWLEHAA